EREIENQKLQPPAKDAGRLGHPRGMFGDPIDLQFGCNMNNLHEPGGAPSLTADRSSAVPNEIPRLAAMPEVQSALRWFRDQEAEFARWQMELARIPAPPFGESAGQHGWANNFGRSGSRKSAKTKLEMFADSARAGGIQWFRSARISTRFSLRTRR